MYVHVGDSAENANYFVWEPALFSKTYIFFVSYPFQRGVACTFVLLCYLYHWERRSENWQQAFLHMLYLWNVSMPRIFICGFTAEIVRFLGIGKEETLSFCQQGERVWSIKHCHTFAMANNMNLLGVWIRQWQIFLRCSNKIFSCSWVIPFDIVVYLNSIILRIF